MQNRSPQSDVHLALKKIFGTGHHFNHANNFPDVALLKKAFHRKSFLYHPDRAKALGLHEEVLTREFQEINDAYRFLLPFIRKNRPRFTFTPGPDPVRRPQPAQQTGRKLRSVPPFELRFAQFLYYKGLIGFQTLIRALIWQIQNRPRAGKIAEERKLLTPEQILAVLREKKIGEPFLQAAVRIGLMQDIDRQRVLFAQKAYNLPIGRFFLEEDILSRRELNDLLCEFAGHNRKYR